MNLEYMWIVIAYIVYIAGNSRSDFLLNQKQNSYAPKILNDAEFSSISRLSDKEHLKQTTKRILIPRIIGTPGHKKVREYIIKSLQDLQWTIKVHSFNDTAPIMGNLEFHNIIATLNPNAERYLVLACHYDSKYIPNVEFLGATDSAVPCAMLFNLAKVLGSRLEAFRDKKLSLMLLFFDGEEAFEHWSSNDSIYGARQLAKKWEFEGRLSRIDVMILLDLLGVPDPKFYSYFPETESLYTILIGIENRLSQAGLLERYRSSSLSHQNPYRYFEASALRAYTEDDHTPFLKRNVRILHIIPTPFPKIWHTVDDNESVIDYSTAENLARIIRIFTMQYLLGAK